MKRFPKILIVLSFLFIALLCAAGCWHFSSDVRRSSHGNYTYDSPFDPSEMKEWKWVGFVLFPMQALIVKKCPLKEIGLVLFLVNSPGLIEQDPEITREIQGYGYLHQGKAHFHDWDTKRHGYYESPPKPGDTENLKKIFEDVKKSKGESTKIGT